MSSERLFLAVALDGAGFHPAAWREATARPTELTSPRYWADLAGVADRALIDFLTIEDSFGLPQATEERRQGLALGQLEAVRTATYLGPRTRYVGLVPTASTTHPEPFHIASGISTLDYVSRGRAGWRPQVSGRPEEAAHVGRRTFPAIDPRRQDDPVVQQVVAGLFEEATDAVEVVRRLWDSWEDDAIIKDTATGRFIDRDKLHSIDFEGRYFSVKGPSIVPRPPQGQPLVVALAHSAVPFRFAASSADVVCVTPADPADAVRWVADVREAERSVARRTAEPLKIFADLVVFLDDDAAQARARVDRLDGWAGRPYRSDAGVFVGTPVELADLLEAFAAQGIEGFRLRPGALPHDLDRIADDVVGELRRRDRFPAEPVPGLLRERLGFPRPASRYAAQSA